MHLSPPLNTVDLFAPLAEELLAVLRALTPAEWDLPTACPGWSVKDVAAHLLGGSLGRLWPPAAGGRALQLSYADLLDRINTGNAEWVSAARRISPPMLLEFLALTEPQLATHFRALDPHAPAWAAVAWAGEAESPMWFDIAREYTEKWLHQQHIREAVGRPVLSARRWLGPVLETFVRGLPHAYRGLSAAEGACVTVTITGEAGGVWTVRREAEAWRLYTGRAPAPAGAVELDQDLAWRLFTKGLTPEAAAPRVRLAGDPALARPALGLVAIMA